MRQTLALVLLCCASLWSQQPLKIQQLDRATPVHGLTFTLVNHAVLPATRSVEKGVYEIRCRNGMFAQDLTFEISRSGQPNVAGDSVVLRHARSANGYGYFRLTPGTFTLAVKEYPAYKASIEVRP